MSDTLGKDVLDELGETLEHKARFHCDEPATWGELFNILQHITLPTPPHRTAADAAMPEGAMAMVDAFASAMGVLCRANWKQTWYGPKGERKLNGCHIDFTDEQLAAIRARSGTGS